MPAKPKPRPLNPQQHNNQHHPSLLAGLASPLPTPGFNPEALAHRLTDPTQPRNTATLNLAVLRRHDPQIASIISVAPFAAVYEFSASQSTWEKTGVEGTLFVVQLAPGDEDENEPPFHAPPPRFAAVVLNRKGLDNFGVPLAGAGAVEEADGGLLIVNARPGVIFGLWIFEDVLHAGGAGGAGENARALNARVMRECAALAGEARGVREEHGGYEAGEGGGWDGYAYGYGYGGHGGYSEEGQTEAEGEGDVLGGLFARARRSYGAL